MVPLSSRIQPGAVGADSRNARRHLVRGRRDFFERDRAPLAIRRIDGGNRGSVGSGGESNRRHGLNINGEFRRFVSSRSSRHRVHFLRVFVSLRRRVSSCRLVTDSTDRMARRPTHRVIAVIPFRAFEPSWARERGRRIRLPAAGAHPSRSICPNLSRLVSYSAPLLAHVGASAAFPASRLTLRYGQRPLHEHGCLADGSADRMERDHRVIEFIASSCFVFAPSCLRVCGFVASIASSRFASSSFVVP